MPAFNCPISSYAARNSRLSASRSAVTSSSRPSRWVTSFMLTCNASVRRFTSACSLANRVLSAGTTALGVAGIAPRLPSRRASFMVVNTCPCWRISAINENTARSSGFRRRFRWSGGFALSDKNSRNSKAQRLAVSAFSSYKAATCSMLYIGAILAQTPHSHRPSPSLWSNVSTGGNHERPRLAEFGAMWYTLMRHTLNASTREPLGSKDGHHET